MRFDFKKLKNRKVVICAIAILAAIAVFVIAYTLGLKSANKGKQTNERYESVQQLFEKAKENNFASTPITAEDGDYEYKVIDEGVVITGFKDKDNKSTLLVIPETLDGKPVIGIGDKAFEKNVRIETVTLGTNVSVIGDRAFAYCTRLKMFVCNRKLGEIGKGAFDGCASLSVISLNEGLDKVRMNAFQGTSIRKLVVPKSVSIFENPFGKTKSAVTVYGEKGSYIENWAEINEVKFAVHNYADNETDTPNPIVTIAEPTEPTTSKKSKIEIDENAVVDDGIYEQNTTQPAETTVAVSETTTTETTKNAE